MESTRLCGGEIGENILRLINPFPVLGGSFYCTDLMKMCFFLESSFLYFIDELTLL